MKELFLASGNAGSGWNDVLPYLIKCEHDMRGASEYQGERGPMNCSDIEDERELTRRRPAAPTNSASRADYSAGKAI